MTNIPLCRRITTCLSVHLLMDIWAVFTFCASWFKAYIDPMRNIILAHFTDEERRLREVKSLSRRHTACAWQSWRGAQVDRTERGLCPWFPLLLSLQPRTSVPALAPCADSGSLRWEFSLKLQAGAGAPAPVLRGRAAARGADDPLLRGGAHLSQC